jgi:signal peptidase I
MNDLKERFNKFYDKFLVNKSRFIRVVDSFKERSGRLYFEMSKRGAELIQFLEREADEIKEIFEKTAASSEEIHEELYEELSERVNKFKKAYSELFEISKPMWRQWAEVLAIMLPIAFVLRTFFFGLYHVPTGSAEPNILVGDRLFGNKMVYRFYGEVKRGDLVVFDSPKFVYEKSKWKALWQKYIGISIPFLGIPSGPDNWVKRVIACPGDTIEGRIEDGRTVIYLNGERLNEPYVNNYPLIELRKSFGFFDRTSLFGLLFPFLRRGYRNVLYTFDPDKELSEQPFYRVDRSEIVFRNYDGELTLHWPFTPSYNAIGENVDKFGPIKLEEGKYWVMGDSRKNSEDSRFWGPLDRSLIQGRASFVIFSVDSEESSWILEMLKGPITFFLKKVRWWRFFKKLS